MPTFQQSVDVGSQYSSRFHPVIARVDTSTTYAVMPAPLLTMLGISPQWTGVFELADGGQEEHPLAEIRMRINNQERTIVCVFGKPDGPPVLGAHTLECFGLAPDADKRRLAPARLFLAQ